MKRIVAIVLCLTCLSMCFCFVGCQKEAQTIWVEGKDALLTGQKFYINPQHILYCQVAHGYLYTFSSDVNAKWFFGTFSDTQQGNVYARSQDAIKVIRVVLKEEKVFLLQYTQELAEALGID